MIRLILAAAVVAAVQVHAQAPRSGPVVDVTGGKVRGRALIGGGAMFLGVPFARPPVGPLRWREPAPVEPWTGIRTALEYAPPCAQNPYFDPNARLMAREDCLYLNVWTPDVNATGGRKPVMVWIPGGGNFAGGSNEATSGEKLMRHDVVVVTVNYRLGLFGFFSHPELTRESPHHASGNQGILDQIAALRWVQANIGRFGGDPSNVTLFGESSGSYDLSVLMTSPLARGLFQRAIGESGAVILAGDPLPLKDAEARGVSLAAGWGAGTAPSLDSLRALPMRAILAAEPNFLATPQPSLGVTIDGYVLPVRPQTVFEQGGEHHVPLLLGNLAHEWVPGVRPPGSVKEAIESSYRPEVAGRAVPLYAESASDSLYGTPAQQWVEDVGFRCPAVAQLGWHAAAGNVTYEFQFEHVPLFRRRGNAHAAEVPYVFGRLEEGAYDYSDRELSSVVQTYWTNFAKTGNPNGPGVPAWPSFDPAAHAYLAFTDDGAVAKADLRRPFCDLFVENAHR